MNAPMNEAARQMMPMMSHPVTTGTMMAATGYAAGRGLLAGALRNPLVLFAAGVAAGYLLHKYQKEIIVAVSKATGLGRDFALQQKESLADMLAEAQEAEAAAPAAGTAPGADAAPTA